MSNDTQIRQTVFNALSDVESESDIDVAVNLRNSQNARQKIPTKQNGGAYELAMS